MNDTKAITQNSRSSFIFKCDNDILNEIRSIASKHRFSIAHFLRESAIQNIATYKDKMK